MKSFNFFFFLFACASQQERKPYLFSHSPQKHEITVYDGNDREIFKSLAFVDLSHLKTRLTLVSPLMLTLMKVELAQGQNPKIEYLNPVMEKQRKTLDSLIEKISELLWSREGELSQVIVLKHFPDGTAQLLEWKLSQFKVLVAVESL